MKQDINSILVKKQGLILGFLIAFYSVGTMSHLTTFLRPTMKILTPLVLFGAGVLAVVIWSSQQPEARKRLLIWVLITYSVTLFLEILGVATGAVFGAYTYGYGLGIRFFDVPLVIGFNWTLVVMGLHGLVSLYLKGWWRIPLTGLAAVVFDLVMETVAMEPRMDYWMWALKAVPLQNYIAWFVITSAAAAGLELLKLKPGGFFARGYVIIQFVFFLILLFLFYGPGIA